MEHSASRIGAMKESPGSKDRWPPRRVIGEGVCVLLITLVGGWIRFHGLGQGSLWYDEAASVLQARLPVRQLLPAVARNVHPPLYYLLLHGALTVGDSEAALRWPSALFGTLSLPLLYWLGRAWFSGSVGLVAALPLALSPVHLWHSQDAKMYTLLTWEGLLAWALFGQLLQRPRRALWVGYAFIAGAILYTHYFGVLLLLPQTALVGLLRYRKEVAPAFWARWLGVQVGLALLFFPWLAYAGQSIEFGRLSWIAENERPDPLWLTKTIASFSAGSKEQDWLLGLPIVALAVVALVRDEHGRWRSPRAALRQRSILLCVGYFAVPIAIMFAASLVRPFLLPRFMLMTAPPFFLLAGVGLRRLLHGRLAIAAAAVLVLLALPGLQFASSTPRTRDYRGLARLIAANAEVGDLVLFYPLYSGEPFEYYVRGRDVRFKWCSQLQEGYSLEVVQQCLSEAQRVWVAFTRLPKRGRKTSFLIPLSEQFRPIRTYALPWVRIVLFERAR